MNRTKHTKGFTLVELVVVIAIVAILAAVAVPNFIGTTNHARLAADKATLTILNKATQLYRLMSNGQDPFKIAGTSDNQLLKILHDAKYLTEEIIKPQTKDVSFVWDIDNEVWALSSAYHSLSWGEDGIEWFNNSGWSKDNGRLGGSYTGDDTDIFIPSILDNSVIRDLWQDLFRDSELTSVEFASDSQIEIINNRAFKNNNLTSIDFPESLTKVGVQAFYNNNIQEIILPQSVVAIGHSAFKGNDDLRTITIGDNVNTISTDAFGDKTNSFISAYAIDGAGTYILDDFGNWIKQ